MTLSYFTGTPVMVELDVDPINMFFEVHGRIEDQETYSSDLVEHIGQHHEFVHVSFGLIP